MLKLKTCLGLLAISCSLSLALGRNSQVRGDITIGSDGNEILAPDQAILMSTLGAEFKDEIHGFRICPPVGARIVKQSGLNAATERLSFAVDSKQWLGTVQSAAFKPASFTPDEYLKSSTRELEHAFRAVQIIESRTVQISDKPAAKLVASMEVEAKVAEGATKMQNDKITQKEKVIGRAVFLKQELAVQVAANEYLIMTLYGPISARADMMRTFNAMAGSFMVLDRAQVDAKRREAIRAGKEWMNTRSAEELTNRLVDSPQFFRIKSQNKDVGYIQYDEKVEDYVAFKGIGVYLEAKIFYNEDILGVSKNHAFWAYARQTSSARQMARYSTWENVNQNVTALQGAETKSAVAWTNERGDLQFEIPRVATDSEVRDGQYVLSVTRTSGNNTRMLTDDVGGKKQWPITQGRDVPAPLPKVLESLWPRLVDLTKPSQMAFVVCNSEAQQSKMGLRTLSVLGPENVIMDGKTIQATHLLDEMDPKTTHLWVDSTGKILVMRTGDNALLVSTTKEKILQLWDARVKQFAYRVGQK